MWTFNSKKYFVFLVVLLVLAVSLLAQEKKNPKPGKSSSKAPAPAAATEQAATKPEPSSTASAEAEPEEQKGPWHGLTWRLIGPFRGGRVLAVSGVVGDPRTYYFGGVGGGVWKTSDGGLTWRPVTDKVKDMSASIGAIAVAPSDPNVVYAATGEACIRGNIIVGNGVFKSTDSGKTWNFSGLRDTQAIGRIIVHPKNPDIVFVAALGHPFGSNPERGIYRTTDGGKNWTKVLFKDKNTGGIDIALDPANPGVLFDGLWRRRRPPV